MCADRATDEAARWRTSRSPLMVEDLVVGRSRSSEWYFCFRSSAGRVLAGGDGYGTRGEMERGVEEARAVLRRHGLA